jgi:hypothetical protein
VGGLGEAVPEQHERPVTDFRNVHPDAVDIDVPALDFAPEASSSPDERPIKPAKIPFGIVHVCGQRWPKVHHYRDLRRR